jgi:hypothetical protein
MNSPDVLDVTAFLKNDHEFFYAEIAEFAEMMKKINLSELSENLYILCELSDLGVKSSFI